MKYFDGSQVLTSNERLTQLYGMGVAFASALAARSFDHDETRLH
jgi:hypothetical protein